MERLQYDEFGLFHENAEEWGLPYDGPPVVRRERVEVGPGRSLSVLVWGDHPPELVFLHGGGQNAHTWDTVAMALGRPLIAVDLPGHGHSDPLPDAPFSPRDFAADVEVVVRRLAPLARAVVGMSLGGLTSIALAGRAPELVRRLVLVDVLPSINRERAAPIGEFINGPASFASFDEILERTIQYNPSRSVSSLRRGVLHNAVQRDDGSWVWRHQMHWRPEEGDRSERAERAMPDYRTLWDDLAGVTMPVVLVYGTGASSVVDEVVLAELERRRPGTRTVPVGGAGHSIQGDQPVVLAGILGELLDTPGG